MKIQVQLYLPDQNQGTVWGYGTITLDQLLTFQIRILTCEKGAGIKEAFVSFPRRKQGERWEDLVIVEDSLRNQIRGSPGSNPDGNHKRFVSSPN